MHTLQIKKLCLESGEKTICAQLDWQINTGEIWGILGANGSGKTTLLHTLAGIKTATAGEILFDGSALTQLSLTKTAQSIALLFQDFYAAFPQTAWEYCLAARYPHLSRFKKESAEDKAIVLAALEKMELAHLAERKIAQLSGGEKRRLAIAAVLAQTPVIYLLDEPSNHLDLRHQIQMLNHFTRCAENASAAVVMSLHDVNLAAEYCHAVLMLLPDGTILQGKTQTLLNAHNLQQVYQYPFHALQHGRQTYWHPQLYS